MGLQKSISTAMIAVQVAIDDVIKGFWTKTLMYQAQQLLRMSDVSGIEHNCLILAMNQQGIGWEPTTLKKKKTFGKRVHFNWRQGKKTDILEVNEFKLKKRAWTCKS